MSGRKKAAYRRKVRRLRELRVRQKRLSPFGDGATTEESLVESKGPCFDTWEERKCRGKNLFGGKEINQMSPD